MSRRMVEVSPARKTGPSIDQMADASAAVEVRMVIMTTFQVNERSYCKQTRRILTEAGIVEARCGSSCVRTSANGRGCVKTRNAIRVRSILFVFQKKMSQNCTWVTKNASSK